MIKTKDIISQVHEGLNRIKTDSKQKYTIARHEGICSSTGQKIKIGDKITYCDYIGINGWILVNPQ